MSNQTLLLEIGLEEMPARFVTNAQKELEQRTAAWLQERRIPYETVKGFSTPRRLAVQVTGTADRQPDMEEKAKGPSEKIGVQDGDWSKAAQGFARGQGVTTEDLYIKEVKGENYLFATKYIKGEAVEELLPGLKDVLLSIPFPKNMRWGSNTLRYVRPIKWLTALYGSEVVPFTVTNVESGRTTWGHRFLGGETELRHADEYETKLQAEHVIADPTERKQAIAAQIQDLEAENSWHIPLHEGLLEEVNQLVEYPTALFGHFDESFLQVPDEVLITSMREHQRYFPVYNQEGALVPAFVTVRNGDHRHLENVQKGNEKVIRARLADAEFFYSEDRKQTLESRLEKLSSIVYHEKLGTMMDKVERITSASRLLASFAEADEQTTVTASRAAALSKADLVTLMVDEFTELEGQMGEYYALHDGESPDTAKAIREHYLPKQSGDPVPDGMAGRIVSMADKLDTLVTSFGIGSIPTGSQDPHGLRRQAAAVLHIYLESSWHFDFIQLLETLTADAADQGLLQETEETTVAELKSFFQLRFQTILKERGIRYDVADAVMAAGMQYPNRLMKKAALINEKLDQAEFKKETEAFSRVTNIAVKADSDRLIQQEDLQEKEEQALFAAAAEAEQSIATAWNQEDAVAAYRALQKLVPSVNAYFDHIMVMTEDPALREVRLAQMKNTAALITSFADFQHLVFHSEDDS
ncbi:glycine--tRNA ligase subunit beta [Alkalicoccus chagannorensis]|uniref:glycine--tRNA ligase subunit beta n=1 Tax=Alkalicoccus chagannorensis TaxID=427072 RepID=UPI0004025ECE|nr:glycine--tRNA ligase subunit beta [Alkalicoccus chagannorensis]